MITKNDIIGYAYWVCGESVTPIGEVTWLCEMILSDMSKEDMKREFEHHYNFYMHHSHLLKK